MVRIASYEEEATMHHRIFKFLPCLTLLCAGAAGAGELGIHVILSGEVAPGVYGQVQIGNAPPPAVVYAQPMLIEPVAAPPPPVYLHVPPGHAKNWRKHCHEYNACNRPVYFVRSEEYDPEYQRRHHGHDHDEDEDHHHGHGHDKDRDNRD
jgi:hypothetical protein